MQHTTKLNVFRLVKRLEEQAGMPYKNIAIAKMTGLSRVTVNSLVAGSTNRIDLATIDKLLDFFHAEGMPITACDLFVTEQTPL